MWFVWLGVALLIMRTPGGGAPTEFQSLGTGSFVSDWVPAGAVIIAIVILLVVVAAHPLARARASRSSRSAQPRTRVSGGRRT